MAHVLVSYGYGIPYAYETSAGFLPGGTIWEQAPLAAYYSDPGAFVHLFQDFEQTLAASNTIGNWTGTVATSGTITSDTTNPSGILLLDAGAVTAGQGVQLQLALAPFKLHATLPTVFEARIKPTGLTSLKFQDFVGLCAPQTAIITSNAVGTDDKIGFSGVTTTGVLRSNTTAAATATLGTGLTVVNSTWYRLGFVATTTLVTFYVNGLAVGTSTTNIPTSAMAPAVTIQSNATVTSAASLDYIRVLGVRQ